MTETFPDNVLIVYGDRDVRKGIGKRIRRLREVQWTRRGESSPSTSKK